MRKNKKNSVPSDQFVFVDLTLFQERDRSLPWSERGGGGERESERLID